MVKSYKTEINPTAEQKKIISRTIGVSRFVYNFYLAHNKEIHAQGNKFVSGMDFSKWLNNEFIPNNAEYAWIYVSVLVESPDVIPESSDKSCGIGIDLGIKDFAVISDGTHKKNINKKAGVKKTEKQLKREQRKLSRKYESLKKRNKILKGEATRQNIQKQVIKVQKLHRRLDNIRTDYVNKIVYDLVKTKPIYITIEDLNISGMMKNKHLSKAVAQQKFREFRVKLEHKCKQSC